MAGLSQDGLAHRINFSSALVAKIELCQRRPTREFAKRCDGVLGTGGLLERLQAVLGPGPVMPWFRHFVIAEQEATDIRCFQLSVVPGLLRTEAYARALLASGGLLTAEQVEEQVATRLARQEILTRPDPPMFTAVMDERVLHQPVGGAEVMRDPLDGRFVERVEDVKTVQQFWDSVRAEALSHQQSIEMIREVAESWN
ncbi:DUF5753 domain-containing protein [Plantactinospora veratri]|uniref:DUF5753 domain-containing protein n=1 Tax=Plantactinospora veratri TaxID=1436122 RepID=A0ABU7S9X2_9ACTN